MADDDVLVVGQGPVTVVAVHGIQGTRGAWMPLAEQLADRCTFVLPNLPGRGKARPPAGAQACSLDAWAQVLRRTLDTHVRGSFMLAGWSMGVSVALAYLAGARQMPGLPLPAELLLVSGTPQLNAVQWFQPSTPKALLEAIAMRERRLGLREAADHRTVAWTWESIRHTDQRGELGRVRCPTLVIHGSEDDDCPLAHGEMLANGIPDAELVVLHGAGHGVLTQRTPEIARHLRARWPAQLA
ncbi:alpha/beta fold hydrolase [Cupriavidus oxalaticus]|jgi:pimeloyl-ACP methyl ester carboxylesterase|uniref:Alpha/beta hydrolase n=1 Tax=Cupriavidus oxalaticus TaxID=96344 RepID=A0A375FLL7_9BURK|nr:alpha/beta hydrolase [Cupriavidus oxalaticus]QRQ88758.1 alpha/beta hydrolase [Cupriavidus oxalaticus]QRQ92916.1 alpha/beta hydrolase [Cupriavidus oxalaticus]WQD81523.1 alpha/beta hydrolase [Cupriavidus oxalaticus]SPC06281.1 putative hydrolase, Alpha/beta hydrolase fold [Cupriavidus oxalaticus]SPC12845.1 putative hydrolase, Alpha/beta hydrolase fold [Cupriavidus oxalaticus]